MERFLSATAERAMKVQEVILKAIAKLITWWIESRTNQHNLSSRS